MSKHIALFASICVALAVTKVASAQYAPINREQVEQMGKNGERYHAADNYETIDWSIFGDQLRYNISRPQMLDGFQKSTAGELGLSEVWNECGQDQACKVVLSPKEVVLYLGERYYLDNCTWTINGKRVDFKNRIVPVMPPPPPEQPPVQAPPSPPPPQKPVPPPPPQEPIIIRLVPPPRLLRRPPPTEEEKECVRCVRVVVTKLENGMLMLEAVLNTAGVVGHDAEGHAIKFDNVDLKDPRWITNDGKVIGYGNHLIISYKQLERLFGKKSGDHVIRFVARDQDDHEVSCDGEITIRRHGRFWLFKIPGLNCLYAWTRDIGNWHLGGAIEKGACLAGGAAIYFLLGAEGVAAGIKITVPVITK